MGRHFVGSTKSACAPPWPRWPNFTQRQPQNRRGANQLHRIGASAMAAGARLENQRAQPKRPARQPRRHTAAALCQPIPGAFTLSANRRQWQTSLQGLFDRQPAAIEAAYSADAAPANLAAASNSRLNLAPYYDMPHRPAYATRAAATGRHARNRNANPNRQPRLPGGLQSR